ncbi:MAG: hypothetical protein WAV28_18205 [Sedimentisphaerales bacterium]|jgi:hypothetical protein
MVAIIWDEAGLSLSKLARQSAWRAGIETGGWKPEPRVSRASIDTSIDNLKPKTNKSKGAR